MLAIILESVLFVVLIATAGGLVFFALYSLTPLGDRVRQIRNRRRLESAAALYCPMHGDHAPDAMVRLPSGELICPECFRETVDDRPY